MPNTKPNLLFVFPDEWRRAALGENGTDPVLTPVLDQFAKTARVVTNAISNMPVCSPYRGMLMTGKYLPASGVPINCNSAAPESYLRPNERCIGDVLRDAGYNCGYIGKWHLDYPQQPYVEKPREDGRVWDEWTAPSHRHGFDFWHTYGVYDQHFTPHYWTNDTPREAPLQIKQWSPEHETDVAIEYLRNEGGKYRDNNKPFALVVSMNPPHMPFEQVPAKYIERYSDKTAQDLLVAPNVDLQSDEPLAKMGREQVKNYFAACTGVDEQFGRMLATLEEQGLAENTVVVFTSDHGEMMGSHDLMYKSVFYEESLGVPFLIRWPNNIPVGSDDLLIGAPDLMPTLLGLLGLGERIPIQVQGKNLSNALLGEKEHRPQSSLIFAKSPTAEEGQTRGLRTLTHLFAVDKTADSKKVWLFDLKNDPYELDNIADQNGALCAHLEIEMNAWLCKNNDAWMDEK